ncbi:MAG: FAD-dependent oxidoreductase [Deltaproteobacteria bacterium]|nr:FAD-dependent oxidoreductase [Deltaproteobacteria bacterium]
MRLVVVGGGWSGCAAALAARKQGAEVVLLERMDMLLGTGLVGGIMRNNGRFTATEEMIAMGGGELFELCDRESLHRNIEFPGHRHASLYNIATIEPTVRALVEGAGVELHLSTRFEEVELERNRVKAVRAKEGGEELRFEGDVFVDATGTAGPTVNCTRHGNGCAMCILRCPTFGGRVSVAAKAGVKELIGRKGDQVGAMSGACKVLKESLSPEINESLRKTGVAVVPIPEEKRVKGKLSIKACQQYALPEFEANLVFLDTGHAKLMSPFFPLDALREVPGCEHARFEDPYAGGRGNSIRYVGMSPRDDALRVEGMENLYCGGEKAGLLVGHTEAICTGTLAGHNAARQGRGEEPLVLPTPTAVGDAIAYVRAQMQTEKGLGFKYTYSGSAYFERMKELGLYTTDVATIRNRVLEAGVAGVFARR